jgi:Cu/Ag efflux protein CusF
MIDSEAGSMSVGHNASKKLGGPDMYSVASSALMAGLAEGKRREKSRAVSEDGEER